MKGDNYSKETIHVLIVDDEKIIRDTLEEALRRDGYQNITSVESGEKALTVFKDHPCHIVLLDKNLPGIDGLKVLFTGRQMKPDSLFIMMTAYGTVDSALRALALGAFNYLTKPFEDIDDVLDLLDAARQRLQQKYSGRSFAGQIKDLAHKMQDAPTGIAPERQLEDMRRIAHTIENLADELLRHCLGTMEGFDTGGDVQPQPKVITRARSE